MIVFWTEEEYKQELQQARMETAIEIMQMLKDGVKYGWTKCLDITYEEIKERYGVEVEE